MKNVLNIKNMKSIRALLAASVVAVSSNTVFGKPLFSQDILNKVYKESQRLLVVYEEGVPMIFSEDYQKSFKDLLKSVQKNALSEQLYYLNSSIDDIVKNKRGTWTPQDISNLSRHVSGMLEELHKLMLKANGEHEDVHEE